MVAVAGGSAFTLEMATRAKTQLIVILVGPEDKNVKEDYADYQKHFQAAADKGLVELSSSANENQSENQSAKENENQSASESEAQDELSISANENQNENGNESKYKCNPCCAIS